MPAISHSGIQIVSVNLLMDNEEAPVIWRGPVIAGVVKQFWTDVIWRELDVLLIDMPPGTGDVPLTVFQSVPLDGVILVSTNQDLVSMVVNKARNMALMMKVRILGFVEEYELYSPVRTAGIIFRYLAKAASIRPRLNCMFLYLTRSRLIRLSRHWLIQAKSRR